MPFTSRRDFLLFAIGWLISRPARAGAGPSMHQIEYTADIRILYDMLTFHLKGTINESIDRDAGRYHVVIAGNGASIANYIESTGVLNRGRWVPTHSSSWFNVRGRISRTEIEYDYARSLIAYSARGETFFLRRVREVSDTVPIPSETHVDDVVSATLNYADDLWREHDGALRTFVVRRRRSPNEGPDDVAPNYRAELAPLHAKVVSLERDGKSTALFDLSPFSSWIHPSTPARIVFSVKRRPEFIRTAMILGSSVIIRFGPK